MDTARYFIALLVIATFPGAILFWFAVHPFVGFWRKLGPAASYTILVGMLVAMAAAMVLMREAVLAVEYGTNWILVALGLLAYGIAAAIEMQCRRHLKFSMLVGLPEIAPDRTEGKLLTDGVYGIVRHPRYVSVFFGLAAVALFTNYLAAYVIWGVLTPIIYFMTLLEERELRDRFGQEYADYCRRVPRFVPRKSAS
jgi:protein-S-isoprenylcysteine O-methyltransferase Ste14